MIAKTTTTNKGIIFSILIASILWFLMFVIKPMNFWVEMTLSIAVLIGIAYYFDHEVLLLKFTSWKDWILGIGSGALLYGVFYIGNIISTYLFPFKDAQIASVYSNKDGSSVVLIGILLLFFIGPGEEIFWRGYVQKSLSNTLGGFKGYLVGAILYAAVHIITLNFMLVIAALVCGLFWGYLYHKTQNLMLVIISHALWDFTIFVLFPIM